MREALVETISMQVTAQMERDIAIKEAQKKFCDGLKEWAEQNVGSRTSSVLLSDETYKRVFGFVVETGREVIYSSDEESKVYEVYKNYNLEDIETLMEFRHRVNIADFSLETSFGSRELGWTYYWKDGNETDGLGVKADIVDGQIGFEWSSELQNEDGVIRSYTYVCADKVTLFWALVGAGVIMLVPEIGPILLPVGI